MPSPTKQFNILAASNKVFVIQKAIFVVTKKWRKLLSGAFQSTSYTEQISNFKRFKILFLSSSLSRKRDGELKFSLHFLLRCVSRK